MDQLASVGVEFDEATIDRIFARSRNFYHEEAGPRGGAEESRWRRARPSRRRASSGASFSRRWAMEPIFRNNVPVRPWGLGAIRKVGGFFYQLVGEVRRRPGMYCRIDPLTGNETAAFLEDTNERVHASARVRPRPVGARARRRRLLELPCPARPLGAAPDQRHLRRPRAPRHQGLGPPCRRPCPPQHRRLEPGREQQQQQQQQRGCCCRRQPAGHPLGMGVRRPPARRAAHEAAGGGRAGPVRAPPARPGGRSDRTSSSLPRADPSRWRASALPPRVATSLLILSESC